MSARPWRLAHRGTVTAAGLLIDRRDADDAARRVLACWEPGCDVVELHDAWAVLWMRPRSLRADAVVGAPLVTLRHPSGVSLRSAIPLQRKEIDSIVGNGSRDGDIVRARAGVAEVFSLGGLPRVDPARWIDPGAVRLAASVTALGDPPAPARVQGATPAAEPWYATTLGPALAAALTEAAVEAPAAQEDPSPSVPWWTRAMIWLRALVGSVAATRRRNALPRPVDAPDAPDGSEAPAAPMAPAGPSWWERVQAKVAASLWGARLERHLGERQAKYLNEVVSMFEEGRLGEAIRRAIPLAGSDPDGAEKPVSWHIPTARKDLAITLGPSATRVGAAIPDMHETLTALYRRAVETLDREGRAEEAAFVLAELLRDPGAAVALLERHGRLDAAASLADRARMDPALRVRLRMRAGDHPRAYALARRHRCYEAAATLLDERHPELAESLRAEHAQHLARTGDLAAAARAGMRIPRLRGEVLGWMDALIARGGVEAARTLPERVRLDEDAFDAVRARVLALCDGDEHRAERHALADALLAPALPSEALETLRRPLVRALVRDAALSGDPDEARRVTQLAQSGADRALAVDLPRWPTFARAPLASQSVARVIDGGDRGLRAVDDLAMLPDGRVLVALGESGAELWSRAGRVLHRFDEPCARVVISDHGDRALALAPRGGSWRVATLDLDARSSRPWVDLRLDAFAETYDGDAWLVAQDGRVLELDAAAPDASALRALAVPGAHDRAVESAVLAAARTPKALVVLARHRDRDRGDASTALHAWDAVTGRETASRALDTLGSEALVPLCCAVDPVTESVARADPRDAGSWALTRISRADRALQVLDGEPVALARHGGWSCALARTAAGLVATLYAPSHARCFTLTLTRATSGRARLDGEHLCVVDDLGRAVVIELAQGRTVRDLRV